VAQSLDVIRGPLGADPNPLDWAWALKWSAILIGGCAVLAAPFVIHAATTKKPGTIWAER
jgi:hypothetical protein